MADEEAVKAAPSLEATLAGLDDNLQPLEEESKEAEEIEESEESKEETGVESEEDTTEETSEEEDEYTINLDDEDIKEDAPVTGDLTPEQQYIVDNIKPITVRGIVGEDKTIKEFKVFHPDQLPSGFQFLDQAQLTSATLAFSSLENQAQRLQDDFRNQSTTKAAQEFKMREDRADLDDISFLQNEGDLPKFKKNPDLPRGFNHNDQLGLIKLLADNNDEAAKTIVDILDYKDKTNQRYMDDYSKGRPYKHIGFEEAFKMYKRSNPSEDPAQKQEDAARTEIAKKTSRTKTTSVDAKPQAKVHSGMGSRDLDAMLDQLTDGW